MVGRKYNKRKVVHSYVGVMTITVFKDTLEDQGSLSWSSSITTSFLSCLLSFACQEALSVVILTRGAKYFHVLCSCQSVLVLSQPSDIINLVPRCLVLLPYC